MGSARKRTISMRLKFEVDPEQYQKVYGDLTDDNPIALAIRDYVAQLVLNSPLAGEDILIGSVDASVRG